MENVFCHVVENVSFPQCISSLESSVLPEAAELLQILHKIEMEGLLAAHDKLAVRQVLKAEMDAHISTCHTCDKCQQERKDKKRHIYLSHGVLSE